MSLNQRIETAIAGIEAAAFNPMAWDDALRAVAAATGSRFGQLVAISGPHEPAFNRLPDMDLDLVQAWAEVGGHHPAINSRVRIGAAAAPMRILDETDFTTETDARLNPAYGDLIEKADIPFICLTTLISRPSAHVGLAVIRGDAQGNIEAEDRRVFGHLAAHVRDAAHTALALNIRETTGVCLGLETLEEAAFVCDLGGQVLAMTPRAETLLRSDAGLVLQGGRLVERVSGQDLSARVRAVSRGDLAARAPLILRDSGINGLHDALLLEFSSLPSETAGFPGAPGALIIARRPRSRSARFKARMAALHSLTPREVEVAAALCDGLSPAALGPALGMGLGTVRTHIRHLFDKTGAVNQIQLMALLRAYDA